MTTSTRSVEESEHWSDLKLLLEVAGYKEYDTRRRLVESNGVSKWKEDLPRVAHYLINLYIREYGLVPWSCLAVFVREGSPTIFFEKEPFRQRGAIAIVDDMDELVLQKHQEKGQPYGWVGGPLQKCRWSFASVIVDEGVLATLHTLLVRCAIAAKAVEVKTLDTQNAILQASMDMIRASAPQEHREAGRRLRKGMQSAVQKMNEAAAAKEVAQEQVPQSEVHDVQGK